MRAVPNGTVFHMGIDLLPDGGAAGDAIAAVDTGTVIDLFMPAGIAAKKIVIESTGSAHRFAYLHTFKNQTFAGARLRLVTTIGRALPPTSARFHLVTPIVRVFTLLFIRKCRVKPD